MSLAKCLGNAVIVEVESETKLAGQMDGNATYRELDGNGSNFTGKRT
jgi:hypothetical protein